MSQIIQDIINILNAEPDKKLRDIKINTFKKCLTEKNKISSKNIKQEIKNLLNESYFVNFFKENNIIIDDFNEKMLFFIWLLNIKNPYCKTCNKPVKGFRPGSYFLREYCSIACRNKNKELIEKTKKTFLKKYGVDSYVKTQEFKNKQELFLKDKSKREKRKLKIKQTFLKKYGVDNPMKIKEIKEKALNTFLRKYNVDNPMKHEKIKEKIIKNELYKYGVYNPMQRHLKNLDKLNKKYIEENFIDQNKKFLLNKFMKFYNCSQTFAHGKLKEFNIFFKSAGYSNSEKEIVDFIKSIYSGEIIENSRNIISPYELDIYIPEKNLAIEFNGLFWHSIDSKELINEYKFKHLKKTQACEDKNINLLHIFENEWIDPRKQEIWKSVISYKLGVINKKYYARKLRIVEIDSKIASQFFEENHLQGNTFAKINLALIDNNDIISVMTFSKPRYSKIAQYELIRFASKKFTACVGCAQKLFKHFIEKYQPESVVSYANRRWAFKNNIYQKLGFEFIKESEPNYFYFKTNDILNLYPRVKFQKHKLKNYSDVSYDPSLTETEIMFNSGYRRIYDAGNLVYLWRA